MVDKQYRGNENKEKSWNVVYTEHPLVVGSLQYIWSVIN
jgi:hypothetical protein